MKILFLVFSLLCLSIFGIDKYNCSGINGTKGEIYLTATRNILTTRGYYKVGNQTQRVFCEGLDIGQHVQGFSYHRINMRTDNCLAKWLGIKIKSRQGIKELLVATQSRPMNYQYFSCSPANISSDEGLE